MSQNFEQRYQLTPSWLRQKIDRRKLLKSAAGASALVAMPAISVVTDDLNEQFQKAVTYGEWQVIDAVYQHILPSSASGPSAKEINATLYLYLLVHEQPTDKDEIEFIFQGVGWLEGFTLKRYKKNFTALNNEEKEQILKGISRSNAGTNWLNMLILNLYEAMLSPPAYGGNPNGIGWSWLEHQMGFPLPEKGNRYFELPPRSKVAHDNGNKIAVKIRYTQDDKKRRYKA